MKKYKQKDIEIEVREYRNPPNSRGYDYTIIDKTALIRINKDSVYVDARSYESGGIMLDFNKSDFMEIIKIMYDNGELNCMMNEEKKGLKARLFGKRD